MKLHTVVSFTAESGFHNHCFALTRRNCLKNMKATFQVIINEMTSTVMISEIYVYFCDSQISQMSSIHTITANIGLEKYKTTLSNGNQTVLSDELIANGGAEAGFTPTELLCSALASCTVITLKMYTDHKQWNVGEIKTNVTYEAPEADKPGYFKRDLSFENPISSEQSERLITVAGKCPIHKILSQGHQINTHLI